MTNNPTKTANVLPHPGTCETCKWWVRGFRGQSDGGFAWIDSWIRDGKQLPNPFGDCRVNPPAPGEHSFGRSHADDWCRAFEGKTP